MADQHKNGVAKGKTSLHQQQFFLPGHLLQYERHIQHFPHLKYHLPTTRALIATTIFSSLL
eukprot:1739587-Prorocentrum_lima.AAC.1